MAEQPVALIEYNTYEYSLQPVTLSSGKVAQALRQSKQKSSIEIFDFKSLNVNFAMGEGADDFEIDLNNDSGKYTDTFIPFQEIAIYVGFPQVAGRIVKSELAELFVGLIDSCEPSFSTSEGHMMKITGRSYAAILLDTKITENYDKMTASAIVKDIVNKYGLGLPTQVVSSQKKYSKTINTSGSALSRMKGRMAANVKLSQQSTDVISKFQGISGTTDGANMWLFKDKTAWEAIEKLAEMENAEILAGQPDNNREIVTYFDGKTFYFGPRRNVEEDPSQLIQLNVTENVERYKFKLSTEFLKTRLIMKSRELKNGLPTKKTITVVIPDDLKAGVDIDATTLQGFQAAQKLYGIREILLKDEDKTFGTGISKMKKVGISKFREFVRLIYSGDIEFTFLSDLDNAKINMLKKDMAVLLQGVPAQNGSRVPPFDQPQSRLLNAIFYIEKAKHSFSEDGYRIHLSVSSRKPQRQKQLSKLTTNTSGLPVKINSGVSDESLDLETEIID